MRFTLIPFNVPTKMISQQLLLGKPFLTLLALVAAAAKITDTAAATDTADNRLCRCRLRLGGSTELNYTMLLLLLVMVVVNLNGPVLVEGNNAGTVLVVV